MCNLYSVIKASRLFANLRWLCDAYFAFQVFDQRPRGVWSIRCASYLLGTRLSFAAVLLSINTLSAIAESRTDTGLSDCKHDGFALIQIGSDNFRIPHSILTAVVRSNGTYERNWRCLDQIIEAKSFFISITRTKGDHLYDDWMLRKGLPNQIGVSASGRIANFTDQLARNARKGDVTVTTDPSGYEVISSNGINYFDAGPLGLFGFDRHPIVFVCSREIMAPSGHRCNVSYPYDHVIDLNYVFYDGRSPKHGWPALDARVREFLQGVIQQK